MKPKPPFSDTPFLVVAYLILVGLVSTVGARIAARYLTIDFIELFVVLSGIAGLAAVMWQLVESSTPDPGIKALLAEIQETETEVPSDDSLEPVEVVTSNPGRTTLEKLTDNPDRQTVSDLARDVAQAVHLSSSESVPEEKYMQIHAQLYKEVFPEMDRQGIIEFDREKGTVKLTDAGAEYGSMFESGETNSEPDIGHTGLNLDINISALFDLYTSKRIIDTLDELAADGGELTIRTLSDRVARREAERVGWDETSEKRVYVSMYQTHLADLIDVGLAERIGDDIFSLTTSGERVQSLFATVQDEYKSSLSAEFTTACGLLSNQRRRLVLEFLVKRESQMELGDLASEIAAFENNTSVEALDSNQRKRAFVGLYQAHLPRLDEEGMVNFNKDTGKVTLTDEGRRLESLWQQVSEQLPSPYKIPT